MLRKLKELSKSILTLVTKKETVLLFKLKKKFRTKKRTKEMRMVSFLGAAGFIWMVPAFILLSNPKKRLSALSVFVGMGIDVLVNNLVTKFFFHRTRPCVAYPQEYLRFTLPVGFSFPSGHALTSATGATIYILINPLNGIWAVPLAGVICFSRLYLFNHYPTDILVGVVDGVVTGKAVFKLVHRVYDERYFPILNALVDDNALFELKNYFTKVGRVQIFESLDSILVGKIDAIEKN